MLSSLNTKIYMSQETNQIYSLIQLGIVNQRSIMLYGDNEAIRHDYVKDSLWTLKTNDNIDVKLVSIDLSKLDKKQLNEYLYPVIKQDQRCLLFLDNLDKASFDVYESARLFLKNQSRPSGIIFVAGLSREKVEPDYIDDGLVSSCLHIEI